MQACGHGVELAVAQARGDAELAAVRSYERELLQVTAQSQRAVVGLAGDQRVLQPGARPLRHDQRDVLVRRRRRGARDATVQVDDARSAARRAAPRAAGLELDVVVARVERLDAHFRGRLAGLRDAPVHDAVEPRKAQARRLEHAREQQRGVAGGKPQRAAGVGRFDAAVEVLEGRQARMHPAARIGRRRRRAVLHAQCVEAGTHRVPRRRREFALPGGAQVGELAARLMLGERRAQRGRQRQASSQRCHVLQHQAVGIELATRIGARRAAHQAQARIQRRHDVGLRQLDRHAGERDLAVAALGGAAVAQRDAPARARQLQRLEIRRQAQVDLGKRDIGHHALRAQFVEVEPYTQCALRLPQGDLLRQQRHHRLQLREIRVVDGRIQASAPVGHAARAAELRRAEIHAQIDRRRQRGRRTGLQRELMRGQRAPQVDAHVGEDVFAPDRLVDEAQGRVAHDDAALVEQPVERIALAGVLGLGIEHVAGHRDAPVGEAAHFDLGREQVQRGEARLESRHAEPGQRSLDLAEAEARRAGGVEHAHVGDLEGRLPAVPGGRDAADVHRRAQLARQRLFELRTLFVDARQPHVARQQEQRAGREVRDQHGDEQDLQGDAQGAQAARAEAPRQRALGRLDGLFDRVFEAMDGGEGGRLGPA